MSGVTGAARINSRADFDQFIKSYTTLISQFPGFIKLSTSGSYNSDLTKNTFGDIDLIVQIDSDKDKTAVKKDLQAFLLNQPSNIIVPFTSEKYTGKRAHNSGELISVRFYDASVGYSVQVDNIVALSANELSFKKQFLDLPAEKQGLMLGLVKVATIENDPIKLFRKLNIFELPFTNSNEEYEFNLSSVELQLRKVTYEPGTFTQIGREVIWKSCNFNDVYTLLYQYDLDTDFDNLLAQCVKTLKNPRSGKRIQGVFSSMITVKSGEVGTAKGARKEEALDKIKQAFGNNNSTIVFAFGRFQPPTLGHKLLIDTVKDVATKNSADYAIYASKTCDSKTNPLSIEEKMRYLSLLFPDTNFVAANDNVRTFIEAAKELNKTYTNLIMVAGGDRVKVFNETLKKYNGVEYNYQSIEVVSAGERDPDSDNVSSISGTIVRGYALAGDDKSFQIATGAGDNIKVNGKTLFQTVRERLGVASNFAVSKNETKRLNKRTVPSIT